MAATPTPAAPVAPAGRKHQHWNEPKPPDPDSTNAVVMKTVVDGKGNRTEEAAPVPETHSGGMYITASGKKVNANGHSLEFDGSPDEPITLNMLVREVGADNPLAQKLIAREQAKARKAAVSVSVDEPAQLDSDVEAAARFESLKGKKK
jgi:hypothetical protein